MGFCWGGDGTLTGSGDDFCCSDGDFCCSVNKGNATSLGFAGVFCVTVSSSSASSSSVKSTGLLFDFHSERVSCK